MGFLIDTNLWIAVERGQLSAADIHAVTKQAAIYLSPVNLAEIRFGIEMMTEHVSSHTTNRRRDRATGDIRVTVTAVRGEKVRIGITAPPTVRVDRAEIHARRAEFADRLVSIEAGE